ncbi:SDR family NAD(P)-dependent oxidoreductase [Gordonia sp. NPDC127522]|uniref:SDR family NAD(P)-dependent oxidoreductase n=1 Tax=Gordonia sp. NPDC127522 TaxID=3345390 RepID=UPI00362B43C7
MTEFGSRVGAALVTGGTGGIGSAVCRRLGELGSDVVFTYRNNGTVARKVAADIESGGRSARGVSIDLTDSSALESLIAEVVEQFGGVHTVVHAAGPHVPMVHLSKVSPDQLGTALQGEVTSFFTVVSAALPELRRAHGSVTAVTTAATARFPVRDGLSAGPKAAVESLVRAFAVEEGRFGVRFNSVGPGMLTDGMADRLISTGALDARALEVTRSNIPLRRFGVAADIAEAVVFLASDRANFISGQKLDVDGGYGV